MNSYTQGSDEHQDKQEACLMRVRNFCYRSRSNLAQTSLKYVIEFQITLILVNCKVQPLRANPHAWLVASNCVSYLPRLLSFPCVFSQSFHNGQEWGLFIRKGSGFFRPLCVTSGCFCYGVIGEIKC